MTVIGKHMRMSAAELLGRNVMTLDEQIEWWERQRRRQ